MTARWMLLLVVSISIPTWGQSQPQDRFGLTALQVARTLTDNGMQISAERVSLPAKVVATEPNPLLDVLSVGPFADQWPEDRFVGRSLVKMACHIAGACLPFYAVATFPKSTVRQATIASSSVPDVMSMVLKPKIAIIMRAGAHATLVMDDDRSHIQVAVISLESGIVGRRIRVASADRKQVFVAEVVSASLLRRSF